MPMEAPAAAALEIFNLSKSYRVGHVRARKRPALHELTLAVARGEVFGYIGPNGSGKTTTLKLLMGLVSPDTGSASVLGKPLDDPSWKYRAGYVPEHPYFYDYLTAGEYLDYAGRLFGLPAAVRRERSRRLLAQSGLERSADIPMRRFSKGMTQRLGIAQALINDPEILFLDEPMSGLDPIGRRLVRGLILDLKKQGKTVFFSTHILPDAEALCDRVGVLNSGRLLKTGRLDEILKVDVSHVEVLVSGGDFAAPDGPPAGVQACQALGERWRLEVAEGALTQVLQAIQQRGGKVLSVQPVRQSLEDYFFKELGGVPGEAQWELQD